MPRLFWLPVSNSYTTTTPTGISSDTST
uniref:Uncharacterized protein n=1 Tax=Arundo donax TaxID=35708 RepID=A0A0A9FPW7_ARUDO